MGRRKGKGRRTVEEIHEDMQGRYQDYLFLRARGVERRAIPERLGITLRTVDRYERRRKDEKAAV